MKRILLACLLISTAKAQFLVDSATIGGLPYSAGTIVWGTNSSGVLTNSLTGSSLFINGAGVGSFAATSVGVNTNSILADGFYGNGANLQGVTAAAIPSGVTNDYHNASNLSSGTLADARLSSNVANLTNLVNQTFSGPVTVAVSTNTTSLDAARINGNGAAPTITANTNAANGLNFGGTATLNTGSSVLAGVVTFVTPSAGSATTATCFTNTYPSSFVNTPAVIITMVGPGWVQSGFLRSMVAGTSSTTNFTVQVGAGTLAGSTTFQISYAVIGK